MNKKVLNVGGGASKIVSPVYEGWTQEILDIDPGVNPDICCDINDVRSQVPEQSYDAVYSSHCLEHVYRHEVQGVLSNFLYLLVAGGFVEIHVPNLRHLIQEICNRGMDITDTYYRTGDGTPISFHDVLYGWGKAMSNGNLYYSHKCGFTPYSLKEQLELSGFVNIQVCENGSNLSALAFKPK
jgi:hypothetical protein